MVLSKVLSRGEGKDLRRMQVVVGRVNALEAGMRARSDAEVRRLTGAFRGRLADGEGLDGLLPEAFAVVREASRRTLGMRHFDVQLIGGVALHQGFVAEMRTGEGKTLVATLPAYLNALGGQGVHVVTGNDYLARRDAEWMGPVYRFLGMEVGAVLAPMKPGERRASYAADVTYGTGNELGFDYLRDNMAVTVDALVQRGLHYAIVDDVDFVLIDQARTPLIISGPTEQEPGADWYQRFARLASELRRDVHYEVNAQQYTVVVTDEGATWVEERLGCGSLYDSANAPLLHHLLNAIRAKELYARDQDYVVGDGEVLIVDETTGRVVRGRRYSDGLHQALEAKEGVPVRDERQTYALITLQNYFRLYDTLAGMTGTAKTEQAELNDVYKLSVVEVPTNRPMIRVDHPEVVYRTEQAKLAAVVEEVARRHAAGQPVLVGTVSIGKSERLSRLLDERGIEHDVLNAKNHEREAHVIAQAGRIGAVTVATNMAGRGVDIMLGGNPAYPPAGRGTEEVAAEHDQVVQLGGLCVLGTERHESRRADNQLRGRAGRQGDPGESRFFLSVEDDLVGSLSARTVAVLVGLFDDGTLSDGAPATHRLVALAVDGAQRSFEAWNARRRKTLLGYDEVLDEQREVVYQTRRAILNGADPRDRMRGFLAASIKALVAEYRPRTAGPPEWDLDGLLTELATLYPVGLRRQDLDPGRLEALLLRDGEHALAQREAELGTELLAELERAVLISVLDRHWREHLYEVDCLQDAIRVLTAGQRDPLGEYRRRTLDLFREMEASIRRQAVSYVFYSTVERSG